MLEQNIDSLLGIVARIGWVLFAIYSVIFFIRTAANHGLVLALIRMFSFRVLGPLLLVVGISLLSLSLVFIRPPEVGVVVSILSPGGIRPQPLRSGLHWIVPLLEQTARYPTYWQTYTMSGKPNEGEVLGNDSIRARTSDGQEVLIDISVIFKLSVEQAVSIHQDWQDRYIDDFVRPLIRGEVRTSVSQFGVDEVNSSKRKDLESDLDNLLKEEFAEKGLILDQFLLRDITFSPEYAAAIEEKQVALEGEERTRHEADQIRNLAAGERDRLRIEAAGEAEAIRVRAEAQAEALRLIAESLHLNPDLITYEYVNKLSPNLRAMLVPNNAPLILPLPSMLDDTQPLTNTQISTTALTTTQSSPPDSISIQSPGEGREGN